ncbi:MAG: hypothetical protein KA759_10425, partial [Zoogloea sp.]|nr:hypothetical protein [Zoogloea sp.]
MSWIILNLRWVKRVGLVGEPEIPGRHPRKFSPWQTRAHCRILLDSCPIIQTWFESEALHLAQAQTHQRCSEGKTMNQSGSPAPASSAALETARQA